MCKFCESGFSDMPFEYLNREYKKDVYDVYLWTFNDENKPYIFVMTNCNTKMPSIKIPIRYCPMCGNKLKRKKW